MYRLWIRNGKPVQIVSLLEVLFPESREELRVLKNRLKVQRVKINKILAASIPRIAIGRATNGCYSLVNTKWNSDLLTEASGG
jgi:hypothetical protein